MTRAPRPGRERHNHLQGGPQRPAGPHSRRAQEDERPPAAAGGAAGRAVSTGGAGPVTHELGERPAIADRRERVGDWEGDTVAGRMSGAVLVTPARPGHQVVPGGRQGPLQTRGGRLIGHRAGPGPPHRRPLTVDRGHKFAPGPALQEPLGAPLHFCKARCPWQRGTGENTNAPAARGAPPPGPHWTASTPRGPNRCTINSTNDPANASAGKPLRKPTHTARCTSCEKPRAL